MVEIVIAAAILFFNHTYSPFVARMLKGGMASAIRKQSVSDDDIGSNNQIETETSEHIVYRSENPGPKK